MSSLQAIIIRVYPKLHPNAEKLEIVSIGDTQVITGKGNYEQGDLAIYFPAGGKLSREYLYQNSEFREGEAPNKEPGKFGYFEATGRIKSIKLRGEYSNGYLAPLSSLKYIGDLPWEEGYTFNSLNGYEIYTKYESRRTQQMKAAREASKSSFKMPELIKRHFDTKNIFAASIPSEGIAIITLKMHGTSGRTGNKQVPIPHKDWKATWNKYLGWIHQFPEKTKCKLITGSRNVVFNPDHAYRDEYRKKAEELFFRIPEGYTFYYEIVGRDDNNKAFFSYPIKSKEAILADLKKAYGNLIEYDYGLKNHSLVYVYRITDKEDKDLSWEKIKTYCQMLHLNHVPELCQFHYKNKEELIALIKQYLCGKDIFGNHPREGVCIRIGSQIFKAKNPEFIALEDQTNEDFVDIEDIS